MEVDVDPKELLKRPWIELPISLKHFAKDGPGWRFAVVVVWAIVVLGVAFIQKLP